MNTGNNYEILTKLFINGLGHKFKKITSILLFVCPELPNPPGVQPA